MDAASIASSEGSRRKRHHSSDEKHAKKRKHLSGERRGSMNAQPARDPRDIPERRKKKSKKMKRKEATVLEESEDDAEATKRPISNGVQTRSPSPMIDFDGLSRPSKGTRERLEETKEQADKRLKKMADAVRTILECVGEDVDRAGVLATPERYAKALLFFTKGYQQNVRDIVNNAIFDEDHNEMVIVKDIEIFSMCEHHMVPFTGKVGPMDSNPCWTHWSKELTVWTDAHRLHSRPVRHWHLETTANRRDVCPPAPDTRAIDQGRR